MNPRTSEARGKDAVAAVTSCYVDLDLPEGEALERALEQVTDGDGPRPSYVVQSGYGLHVVYLLREPATKKLVWRKVQRELVRRFADLGADPKMEPDESRVLLRLVPYPNRKRWRQGVPTAIVYQSGCRYDLTELAEAFTSSEGTSFARHEILAFAPRPFVEERRDGEDIAKGPRSHRHAAKDRQRMPARSPVSSMLNTKAFGLLIASMECRTP